MAAPPQPTINVKALHETIKALEEAQHRRSQELEKVKNELLQYLNLVFVAVGVVYSAVLASSKDLQCSFVWSPVVLTTAIIAPCCWVTWKKVLYGEQRAQRIQDKAVELRQHKVFLHALEQQALEQPAVPVVNTPPLSFSSKALLAVLAIVTLLVVLLGSYVHVLCLMPRKP